LTRLTPPNPQLSDGIIRLEPLARSDVAEAWAMWQDEDVKRFTYVPTVGDETAAAAWIARYEASGADGARAGFSIRDDVDGRFLGFAAIVHLDLENRQGEIGYMIDPGARGRGASIRAVGLLTRWGFDQLGLLRLELRIDEANAASKRVAERAGYRHEGVLRSLAFKDGRRTDTGVWSRLPGDSLSV
jgi:RimJ/RimL family protein N-acetyltransferase